MAVQINSYGERKMVNGQEIFEEQFPELVEKTSTVTMYVFKGFNPSEQIPWVLTSDIEKYCLSKQRVKEAIEKLKHKEGESMYEIVSYVYAEDLLKELNL